MGRGWLIFPTRKKSHSASFLSHASLNLAHTPVPLAGNRCSCSTPSTSCERRASTDWTSTGNSPEALKIRRDWLASSRYPVASKISLDYDNRYYNNNYAGLCKHMVWKCKKKEACRRDVQLELRTRRVCLVGFPLRARNILQRRHQWWI